MSSKVFGFIGMECYDLIFYAAKAATSLGFPTLMVDLSPDHELCYLYPGSFSSGDIVDVDGVSLMGGQLEKGCFSGYDYIFINYGRNRALLDLSDEIYLVTNFQKHNIAVLDGIVLPDVPRYMVVRDRGACSINYGFILEELPDLDIGEEEIYAVEDSDADIQARVFLQYSMKVKFSKLSDCVKDFVKHILEADFSHRDIDSTWKQLVKG